MIILDGDLIRVRLLPDEAYAPLIVDSNAVLAVAFAAQFLEVIAGRRAEVIDRNSCVKHD